MKLQYVLPTILLLSACNRSGQTITKMPDLTPIAGKNFSCIAILSTDTWRDPEQNGNLVTTTKEGTDQLAITIEGETMQFNTRASLEAGMARGAMFSILRNDEEAMISAYLEPSGFSMNTFSLNKATGHAVWTKTRAAFLGQGVTSDTIHLICK